MLAQMEGKLPPSWKGAIKECLTKYLEDNENHLPVYFFPKESAGSDEASRPDVGS
ncbi:hypothetical protein FOL47_007756 [Perkinsus chesapeaki]|uniref:Uncharacterized protein n=1 Tax=Perkinsus chesapeaki TaxID=330153 RepID=A0A7J6MV07_PERCH|nr:hypothetical protein FOL47_007756 [Perkinsus chesapeaki]